MLGSLLLSGCLLSGPYAGWVGRLGYEGRVVTRPLFPPRGGKEPNPHHNGPCSTRHVPPGRTDPVHSRVAGVTRHTSPGCTETLSTPGWQVWGPWKLLVLEGEPAYLSSLAFFQPFPRRSDSCCPTSLLVLCLSCPLSRAPLLVSPPSLKDPCSSSGGFPSPSPPPKMAVAIRWP